MNDREKEVAVLCRVGTQRKQENAELDTVRIKDLIAVRTV